MGQLLTPETLEFFARYLVAGYVVIVVRARFVTGLRLKSAEIVVEAFIFSLINQVLFSFGMWLWSYSPFAVPAGQVSFYLEVLALPTILGLALGLNLARGWNNALLRRLSAPIVHPAARAHDFAFGHNRSPCLVIVSYFDGTSIRGYFGENSLAATDETRSDLFLERLYVENDTGEWIEQSPGRSGLVSLDGVRSIEFLDEEDTADGT